jgi:protoheme IX farnesyltransferase
MKASVSSLDSPVVTEKSRWSVWTDLFKARLTFLVLLTTLVGFYIGSGTNVQFALMAHTIIATALLACGAAALNQFLERDLDARMQRTDGRPLPAGRLHPNTVLLTGAAMALAGMLYLAAKVNLLTSLLGALTLVTYLFVYTPLKRVTWLNTAVGAIPGALPPLMGWTGAGNDLDRGGWALFAILFFWQIPHFLAIAWLYREDYARAGFVMLPNVDPEGSRTGSQAVSHTLGLLFVSVCPVAFRIAGWVYFVGALVLGAVFLVAAIQFSRQLTTRRARHLFVVSILYLPLLLGLMVLDKLKN